MIRSASVLLAVCLALAGVSCGPRERARVEAARAAAVSAIQPISYRRSGGGGEDLVKIAPDGAVLCSGSSFGKASAQLGEYQMMRLARVFEGWEKLKDSYPGPEGAADAAVVQITFGGKTVTVSDAARDVPEQLKQARKQLERLPRELPVDR